MFGRKGPRSKKYLVNLLTLQPGSWFNKYPSKRLNGKIVTSWLVFVP